MLFGSYIRDYEQLGADRALCRQRFDANPSIRKSLISELGADTRTSVLRLCFHHLVELLALEDPLKRAFYKIEYIRGNWSVRTIKRPSQKLGIRDSYIFKFLSLKPVKPSANPISKLRLGHLHDFLMELGHGFCLDAQQKSIVIGKT